ncbi:phage recombination protein Bet [Ralstonia pickettii]|uniref:phage recombination protein Bet n=1 Tax=Ralstonia pickettii TaxID=329 RepID=UPI0015FA0209|nr:phage recombination protein Bet [Ralstonia pickettii]MBB0026793.1 phage recombination protein Bet [Ralstonia pickettii]MBB0034709.1 phage recombination protein Bet [Ralstonia pickettii]MBB0099956.1 phage recombination protein Bet [Ralstonia pickettii]MBB0109915.1 phage recombination protein Bet [Ralstonia pickettii]MBB0130895.1 phage recombination protein Bet [Ralstonia pickettii]
MSDNRQVAAAPRASLVAKFADKYTIEPSKLMGTLKATAFKQQGDREVTDEQMAALLIVADQYGLNPFTKEIYAFPDKGGIVPVVGVDGWARIVNEHPQCDGFEFTYAEETISFSGKEVPEWMEVRIYRKDRQRPVIVREYFDEVVRENMQPWKSHPNRMLRHKTFVQGARLAFGFAGVFDEDEGERIVERDMGTAQVVDVPQPNSKSQRSNASAQRPSLIEQADADGVLPMDLGHQETAPVPAPAARSTRRAPAPAPAAREPGSDDDREGTPASESVIRILKTKMEQAALGEADMRKHFGFGYDGVTTANYNDVVAWIEDPVGA